MNDVHIFLCPKCHSQNYDAVLREEEVTEKWVGEYENILQVETCRYYDCTCLDCNNDWQDYECDHDTSE